MTLKRAIKTIIFIVLHAVVGLLIMSVVEPAWMAICGTMAGALGTLLLFLFAGDEKSARLFFFENWDELEKEGSPNVGLVFIFIGVIWLAPVICFLGALLIVLLRRWGLL
jgi:hypothetical protein